MQETVQQQVVEQPVEHSAEQPVEHSAEQPVEQFAEQPVPPKKSKKGLLIGIVAAVVVVAVALVLLLTGGVNINELMAGRVFETYIETSDGSWIHIALTFDETGENFVKDHYQYVNGNTAEITTTTETIACAFEKAEDGMYTMDKYVVTVADGAVTSFVQQLDTTEVSYTEVTASSIEQHLEDQAIEIFSDLRVYSYADYDFGQVIPQVVKDYRLTCEAVNETQYRITVTGDYYPNKVDMPSYVDAGGKLTCLVDIQTKTAKIEESVGIRSAMEVYVALSMW